MRYGSASGFECPRCGATRRQILVSPRRHDMNAAGWTTVSQRMECEDCHHDWWETLWNEEDLL